MMQSFFCVRWECISSSVITVASGSKASIQRENSGARPPNEGPKHSKRVFRTAGADHATTHTSRPLFH
jgi:hypothetical protein